MSCCYGCTCHYDGDTRCECCCDGVVPEYIAKLGALTFLRRAKDHVRITPGWYMDSEAVDLLDDAMAKIWGEDIC